MAWTDADVTNFFHGVHYLERRMDEINNQLKEVVIELRIMNKPPEPFGGRKITYEGEDNDA